MSSSFSFPSSAQPVASTSANTDFAAPASREDLQAALKARLIASGEYERLLGVLKQRLNDAGWEDKLTGLARERVRAQEPMVPTLTTLVSEIEPIALDTVPTEIRAELLSMIQTFVEKNVED